MGRPRWSNTLVLMLAAVTLCPAICWAGDSADIQTALDAMEAGNYEAALTPLRAVVHQGGPLASQAECLIGRCHFSLGKIDEAVQAYEVGARRARQQADLRSLKEALSGTVRCYMEAEAWQEALDAVQSMKTEFPQESAALLVNCLLRKGDLVAAASAAADFGSRYPDDPRAGLYKLDLARFTFQRGETDAAFAIVAQTIEQGSAAGLEIDYTVRLMMYADIKAGKQSEVRAYYNRLIAVNPSAPIATAWKYRIACLDYQSARWAAGRQALEPLYKERPLGPWHKLIAYALGDCCARLGDRQSARSAFDWLIANWPESSEACAARGYVLDGEAK